ncbi:MAG: Ig-like domain-containing protein [Proteobacteria bacterium]|nr:Ig-like domain-containing protein [Pseudomonadota bacterium]
MPIFTKLLPFLAVVILSSCGGGGGTPLKLTVNSFTEFKLPENSSGSWVLEASSNKSYPITSSISGGPDATYFSLSGEKLVFEGTSNYEVPSDANKDNVFEVYVTYASRDVTATQTISIRVTDVAEAPVITTLAISDVMENSIAIATIEAADEDRNTSLSYSLVDSAGAQDENLLIIDSASGAIAFLVASNFEAPLDLNSDNTINFSVLVSDGALSAQADYSFAVINENESPVISTTSIADQAEGVTSVMTIAASDPDAGTTLLYSLVASEGLKDEGLLSIDSSSGAIAFVSAPNFEVPGDVGANNTIEFSVKVSDGSLSSTQDFSFTITNVNEAPVLSAATFSIAEQSTAVGTISASDPDGSTSLTYSLASGSDAIDDGLLSINSSTGVVSFLAAPNYESPGDQGLNNVYNFTVNVSDGSIVTSKAYSVSVGNVNEAPVFSIASAQNILENSGSTIVVTASDPDTSSLTYSLSGSDASKFSISSNGVLSFVSTPDYEAPSDYGSNNVFDLSVSVTDGAYSSSVTLVITLTDDVSDNFGIALPRNVALAELQPESE